MLIPTSSYSALLIHMSWNVLRLARIDPPIHVRYLRSGGAATLIFNGCHPNSNLDLRSMSVSSLVKRSGMPASTECQALTQALGMLKLQPLCNGQLDCHWTERAFDCGVQSDCMWWAVPDRCQCGVWQDRIHQHLHHALHCTGSAATTVYLVRWWYLQTTRYCCKDPSSLPSHILRLP